MKNKKQSKNWYVAMTHFLTAGIFFPLAFTFIAIAILDYVFKIEVSPITFNIYAILFLPSMLGLWIGNILAIKYINKKYIVKDKKIILNYSVVYLIIISILFFDTDAKINIALLILLSIIEILIYYFISKIYIAKIYNNSKHVNEQINDSTNKITAENNNLHKKRKYFKWLKILIILIVVLVIFLFRIHSLLHTFKGNDVEPPYDDDLMLYKIDVPENENSYFDLMKFSAVLKYEEVLGPLVEIIIPDEINTLNYLESYNWDEDIVEDLLEENKEVLDIYSDAAQKPNFQYDLTANPDDISYNLPIVALSSWQEVSRLNSIKAIYLMKQGYQEKAFDQAIKSIIIGQKIKESINLPSLVYLTGLSIKETGLETLKVLVNYNSLTSDESDKYKNELKNYYSKNDHDIFKVEYIVAKESLNDVLSSSYNDEDYKVLIENNYYFKPNKTLELFADYYREKTKRINTSCKIKFPEIEVWYPSKYEMLFTENSYGKFLVTTKTYYGIRDRKCEIENLLDEIINSLN